MGGGSSTTRFFLANRSIGGAQNALALAGDYLSAAAFLGSIAMYFSQGIDSLFYAVATLVGWPLLLILFADKLRKSNAFTLSGVLNQKFTSTRLRLLSGSTSLMISLFYLLVQLVGAGTLVSLLFNVSYPMALGIVLLMSLLLVLSGGMRGTTLIQSIKAVLLFLFAGVMFYLVMAQFGFSFSLLWDRVGESSQLSGLMPSSHISGGVEQASLVLGLVLGLLGLPHVLMRFFTVKDESAALASAAGATALIALFFCLNLVIGFGAYLLFFGQSLEGGANMVLLYLATVLGGTTLQWGLSILVIVTILAVIAGLVMAASANISQDLVPILFPEKRESLWVAQLSIIILFVTGAGLAYLFRDFNLAFLFGIAFAWAASAHFPVLFCHFFMKGFNERAAFHSLLFGAVASTLFIVSSDTIWVKFLGFSSLHPYKSPTLFVLPLSFFIAWCLRTRTPKKWKKRSKEVVGK